MLLDVLTVVVLVLASLFLVWLNLRQWRRRKVVIIPTDHDADEPVGQVTVTRFRL